MIGYEDEVFMNIVLPQICENGWIFTSFVTIYYLWIRDDVYTERCMCSNPIGVSIRVNPN